MESYNYQEQQTQYTSPNYYGFTYNNYYTQQPHYNQADSSYLYNNACYNSYSTNSTSPSSLSYSSNNSLYNSTNISQQDIYEPIQACSVSSLNNQTSEFSSPKSYSYSNQTQYTPSISHYQPTTYSSTYTSTPFTSHLNKIDAIECVQPKVKKIKEKSSKSTGPHKRPKVIKLDISKTNIGFGNVVQTALPSDFNTTANNVHKSFNCTECNASFSIAAKLFMHQHKQHKNRSSTECPICGKLIKFEILKLILFNFNSILDKKFNSPANALVHLRAHTQEKTYKCEECHLAFCDSSTLKKHIRTHTGNLIQTILTVYF